MQTTNDCRVIEETFYRKFKIYPKVTAESGFRLWKIQSMGSQTYYKLGSTLSGALWLIDNWKIVPSGVLGFQTEKEMELHLLEVELVNLKSDEAVLNESGISLG